MSTISLTKPKSTDVMNIWPQVDLLPPEVRQGRKFKQTKGLLLLAVLLVLLIAVLGWVYSLMSLKGAQSDLADAKAETDRLTSEQEQYAEVPQIQAELHRTQSALEQGTATEILWKPYLEAIRAVTPAEVSYDTLEITVQSDPTPTAGADPLQAPSVGRVQLTARAQTLPDMAAWMDAIRAIPGLSDPWFNQGSVTDEDGSVYFQITGSVQVNDAAFAHRFAVQSADDGASDSSSTTQPGDASQTPSGATTGGNS